MHDLQQVYSNNKAHNKSFSCIHRNQLPPYYTNFVSVKKNIDTSNFINKCYNTIREKDELQQILLIYW